MRNGAWSAGPVREVAPVVTGVPGVSVSGVSVGRELPSSLPGQARSVGGLSAATATVTGHVGSGVTDRVGTPWTRRDWPELGARVTVSASDGTNQHRLFTGKVDGSASSLAGMGVSIPLVDDTDRLSALVSHEAVFRTMPPRSTQGAGDRRLTGMVSTWVTNLAARAAGYYSTPPQGGYCVVSAPLAGSSWPERGVLDWSGRYNSTANTWSTSHPGTSALDDSIYMADLMAEYIPDPYDLPYSGGITASRPLRITLGANQVLSNTGYVDVRWVGSGWTRYVRLAVSSTRTLTAQILADGEVVQNVVSLAGVTAPEWRFATLTVSAPASGATTMRFEIETDTGHTAAGWADYYMTTTMRDQMWDKTRVYAPPYVGLNGVQVSYGSTPPVRGFRRSFLTRPDDPLANLEVMPHLTATPARDLLEEQSEVECAAVWIDEDGILRWLGHQRMVDGPIVRTLTSSDLADAEIRVDSQDVRRQVTGTYTTWATKTTKTSRIIVYEGPKDELEAGDHAEQIITPPDDEEWVMVDSTPREVWGNIGSTYFNLGYGSYHGWTALKTDGDELPFAAGDGETPWSFGRIAPGTWKWEFTVNKLPAGADRVKTSTRSEETQYVKATYRDRGLPLLRAMGRATSVEDVYTPGATGPSWAPDLEVDFGWWVQHRSQVVTKVQRIANELRKSRAMLSGVEALPDPRLQLGDKIRITEASRTGISVVGIVTSVPHDLKAGEHSMTLGLNVLSVTTPHVTLDEFDAWYSGMTLDQLDAKFAGQTLDQIDANPLQ